MMLAGSLRNLVIDSNLAIFVRVHAYTLHVRGIKFRKFAYSYTKENMHGLHYTSGAET